MADAAARWWTNYARVPPWFVVTQAEQPPATALALQNAGAKRVVATRGRTKAEMLVQALAEIDDTAGSIWIFDSDSRPQGDFAFRGRLGVAPCLYVPDQTGSSRFVSIWAGGALWQSVWSHGFEMRIVRVRKLWYVVGHALGVDRAILLESDDTQRCEDLDLGYKLSAKRLDVRVVGGNDVCLWPTRINSYIGQVGRWFVGDLQAVCSQRPFTGWHGLRVVELITGWWLGPPICAVCWWLAHRTHPAWANVTLGLAVLSLLAPALATPSLIPDGVRPLSGVMLGLAIRPFTDFLACSLGILKLVIGQTPVFDRRVTPKGEDARSE